MKMKMVFGDHQRCQIQLIKDHGNARFVVNAFQNQQIKFVAKVILHLLICCELFHIRESRIQTTKENGGFLILTIQSLKMIRISMFLNQLNTWGSKFGR